MKITTLEQFQSAFNSELEKSINKKYTIESEIDAIIHYINSIPSFKSFQKPTRVEFKNKTNNVFEIIISDLSRNLFSDAFDRFITTGKYNFERLHNDTNETYQIKEYTIKQSREFSEYYKWLNELLNAPQKSEKKNPLSIKQKLLALHYLGLDTRGNDNNKCAEILGNILDTGSENIRKSLSHLYAGKNNDVRTKNNLEIVKQLFDSQGLTDISNKIKVDIENL